MGKIRIGIMGFGRVGRQLFKLIQEDEQFDVVAISDIGQPEILGHLLDKTMGGTDHVRLEKNYLVTRRGRTRLMPSYHPNEIPWDVFGTDVVIDATGRFGTAEELAPHLANGARRVVTSALPQGPIDRVVLYGVNDHEAQVEDRVISAGSASTTATGLALKVIAENHTIEHATMTSVHAYTSDQSLQDYAGADYRRSRSGATNIIPNATPALHWLQQVLPELAGRMSGYALNVPVQIGSMLDVTVSLKDPPSSIDAMQSLFVAAADRYPGLIETTADPIVSSDVRGNRHSLLVDLQGSMLAGSRMFKLIGWHETLGHAKRILDVIATYARLDGVIQNQQEAI